MGEVYTTGAWKPDAGEEEAFVEAWREFAEWASASPGAGLLRLARDLSDSGRFLSFGRWESIEAVRAWKESPQFKERMGRVQAHVGEFIPAELKVEATIGGGASQD